MDCPLCARPLVYRFKRFSRLHVGHYKSHCISIPKVAHIIHAFSRGKFILFRRWETKYWLYKWTDSSILKMTLRCSGLRLDDLVTLYSSAYRLKGSRAKLIKRVSSHLWATDFRRLRSLLSRSVIKRAQDLLSFMSSLRDTGIHKHWLGGHLSASATPRYVVVGPDQLSRVRVRSFECVYELRVTSVKETTRWYWFCGCWW